MYATLDMSDNDRRIFTIQPLASISRDFSREIEASKMAARIAWSSDDGHRYFMRAIIAIPRYAAM